VDPALAQGGLRSALQKIICDVEDDVKTGATTDISPMQLLPPQHAIRTLTVVVATYSSRHEDRLSGGLLSKHCVEHSWRLILQSYQIRLGLCMVKAI
jgi:hypothetical protein